MTNDYPNTTMQGVNIKLINLILVFYDYNHVICPQYSFCTQHFLLNFKFINTFIKFSSLYEECRILVHPSIVILHALKFSHGT